jgi:hypothetical protein
MMKLGAHANTIRTVHTVYKQYADSIQTIYKQYTDSIDAAYT